MRRMFASLVLMFGMVACGGSPTSPKETQTPYGPMFNEVSGAVLPGNVSGNTIDPGVSVHQGYSGSVGGNFGVVLTWTGSADLDLAVGNEAETSLLGISQRNTGNREEVRFTLPSGTPFRIGVLNYSMQAVNYKLTVESPRGLLVNSTPEAAPDSKLRTLVR